MRARKFTTISMGRRNIIHRHAGTAENAMPTYWLSILEQKMIGYGEIGELGRVIGLAFIIIMPLKIQSTNGLMAQMSGFGDLTTTLRTMKSFVMDIFIRRKVAGGVPKSNTRIVIPMREDM